MRYLSHEPSKDLSISERDRLHGAGLFIGLVWETTATRASQGYNAGKSDAIEANNKANDLGWPIPIPLFAAVDFDATVAQVRDYFRGWKENSLRPWGVYGSYGVVDGIMNEGLATCAWQTAGWSGNGTGSGGSFHCADGSVRRLSVHSCMFQDIAGTPFANTDHNAVLRDTITWAWNPHVAPPAQAPKDDEEMLTLYWTQEGSPWAAKMGFDNTHRQGFAVEGRFCTYVGRHANPGEGWDARTTAIRNNLTLQGFGPINGGPGAREVDPVTDDAVWDTLCYMPGRLDNDAVVNVDMNALVTQIINQLTPLVQGIEVLTDSEVNRIAQASLEAYKAELND